MLDSLLRFLGMASRRRTEDELRASEERYRTLVEHSPDAIVVLDVDAGRFVDANANAESLFEIPREELLLRHPAELSPPAQPDGRKSEVAAREHIERSLREGLEAFDWVHRSARGRDIACEVRLVPFPSPTGHRLLRASITDVTWRKKIESDLRHEIEERHRAEQELRQSVELTRRIVDSAQNAFIAMNDEGRIVDWNPQAAAVFGYTKEEVLGRTVAETVIPPELRESHERGLRHFLATGTGPVIDRRIEVTALRRDGRRFPVELTITAVPDGSSWLFAAFLHDITERKEAQAALEVAKEQAEAASRAKSEFLANMSHEIRTPMNAIIGLTELLLGSGITATQRDYLQTVLESSESLLTIINEVLDYSKIEAGRLELEETPFSLRDELGDGLKLLGPRAAARGLELAWHVDQNVPDALVGDAMRLRQLLMNLVGNAIKFTEEGEVVVSVWTDAVRRESADLHVCVRDTGIGIPVEKQQAVFEAFTQADMTTTRRYGGTGLGLAIASRIVAAMQGRIWVESEPGAGSRFHFVIPCAISDSAPPRPRAASCLHRVPVLVVDDNATNRRILEEMLSGWGMTVTCAESGMRGLELLDRGGTAGAPRLIVTDVHMPDMDGYEFIAAVREHGHHRPSVIVLTSGSRRPESASDSVLQIAQTLIKPVKQSELLDAVMRIVDVETIVDSEAGTGPLPRLRPLRILLAEDGQANQKLAVSLLRQWGHDVFLADDGLAAVEACRCDEFDLVLMDVRMPRMDGLDATREIRRRESGNDRHTPIVAMTAHAMPGDREMCLASGMDGYVSKPVRQRELYDAIAPFFPEALSETTEGATQPARRDAGAMPASGAVDWAIALKSVAGHRLLLADVVAVSLDEFPKLMNRLEDAVRARDAATAERLAHSIKGSALMYGAERVVRTARRIEARLHSGFGGDGDGDLDALLRELRAALDDVCASLGEFGST